MRQKNSIQTPPAFRHGRRFRLYIAVLLAGLIVTAANAGVVFYTTTGTFNPAVSSFSFRGTEDWSSATGSSLMFVADPLSPGVANGVFPNGTVVAAGIRVQSNSLRNNPTNTSPGNGLVYGPAGFVGFSGNAQPSKQLSANATNDSFDIIFNSVTQNVPRAVSFSPMFYQIAGVSTSATLTVRVYNQANTLLGSTSVPNVVDCLETAYLGIVTTGSDTLGRVNIWATARDVPGADNISVYGASPTSPILNALGKTITNFTFKLDGQSGQRYAIQSASNLVDWQYIQTNLLSSNSIQLTISATNNLRFYRAHWVP